MQQLVSAILMAVTAVLAEDWPQFRGPGGQGHSSEQGLPLEWSETKNVAWKVPVPGRGWSSPVVVERARLADDGHAGAARHVAAAAWRSTWRPAAAALDVEVFRVRGTDLLNAKNSHASPTPIVDGDRVYVHFGAEGTAAVSTAGDVLWKTRLHYESQHGNGGSPGARRRPADRQLRRIRPGFVAALDTRTGKTRWRTDRREPHSQAYSTPLAIRAADRDQIVSVGAFNAVAYDPQNGKEIWRVGYPDGFSNVPRPVYGAGLVFITTGFQQPSLLAVRPDGKGDVTNRMSPGRCRAARR